MMSLTIPFISTTTTTTTTLATNTLLCLIDLSYSRTPGLLVLGIEYAVRLAIRIPAFFFFF